MASKPQPAILSSRGDSRPRLSKPSAARQLPAVIATLDSLLPRQLALQSQPRSQSTITEKARKKFVRRDGACPRLSQRQNTRQARAQSGRKHVLALDHLLFAII